MISQLFNKFKQHQMSFLIFLKLIEIIPKESAIPFEFKVKKLLHNGANLNIERVYEVEGIIHFYAYGKDSPEVGAFFELEGKEIEIIISKQSEIQVLKGGNLDVIFECLIIKALPYVQRPIDMELFKMIGHRGSGENKPNNFLQLRENTVVSVEYAFKNHLKSVEVGMFLI
jgi:hypothetical protein